MRSWLSIAIFVAACGNDVGVPPPNEPDPPTDPEACETSYLSYGNFGAPFVVNWCRGCHASSVPAGMRQKAPIDVNFDTEADVLAYRERFRVRATGTKPTMPPAGGPTAEERALLAEWIDCGMK
ncbi:MAG: hypothetical protein M4D80_33230 [Myxococcota bacterium]|nr:hypothetical protein [Myxococcota bacterium]